MLHASYKTAREMERKFQNPATNVDAAFAAARSIAAARTLPTLTLWQIRTALTPVALISRGRSSTQTEATRLMFML